MKKKILRRLLPFLLSLTMVSGTVYAEELSTGVTVELVEELAGESTEETSVEDELGEEATEEVPAESEAGEEATEEAPAESEAGEEATEEAPAEDASEEATEEAPAEDASEEATEEAPTEDASEEATEESPAEDESEEAAEESPAEDESEATEEVPTEEPPTEEVVEETTEITDEETGETYDAIYTFYENWTGNVVITGGGISGSVLYIPAKLTYKGKTYNVEGIGEKAYYNNNNITSVRIESGLTYIDESAFKYCYYIQNVELPVTMQRIGANAFSSCSRLTEVNLPKGLTDIGDEAFRDCTSLQNVSFPSTLETLGDSAFRNCDSLGMVVLNNGLKQMGDSAFRDCDALRIVDIPGTVGSVGCEAFDHCDNLMSVSLGNGIQSIDNYAFYECYNLRTIYIPQSVTTIGSGVFAYTGVTVYCEQNSVADNSAYYPSNTTIRYGKPTVSKPTFTTLGYVGGKDVYFKSATENALIFYSTTSSNLTLKDSYVANGARASFENFNGTIYARAYHGGQWSSVAKLTLKVPRVSTPVISNNGAKVTIKTSTAGCTIYYTTDGTTPSLDNGARISGSEGSFTLEDGLEVKAIAVAEGYTNSKVASKIVGPLAPSFTVGKYVGGRTVTFSTQTNDAVIYYSTSSDKISLNDKSVKNGRSVSFEKGCTIYARAYLDGHWSGVSKLELNVPKVSKPTFTVSGKKVKIKTATAGSTIYYTTDGSVPSVYNGTRVNGSTATVNTYSGTLKAIAVQEGYINSDMGRKTLINSNKSRNVSFAVKGVFGGRNVTFNSSVKGAKVYYSSSSSTLTTADKCVNAGDTVLFEDFYGTIYARTYYNGEWGNVCRLILKIPVVNTPSIERLYTQKRVRKYNYYYGYYYYTTETVENGYAVLSTSTPGCRIYYTLDGTTPSPKNGRLLNASRGKVYVGSGNTIRAIAVRNCYTNSNVRTSY